MGKRNKFYVVWEGWHPGVYDNWEDAHEQVIDYPGARYKGFESAAAAAQAFRENDRKGGGISLGKLLAHAGGTGTGRGESPDWHKIPEIDTDAWAVDASCLGNPGVMEYRGLDLHTGRELFRVGPFEQATNNLGEFLAIVHAMALMTQRGEQHTIYSDSVSGMAWARNRKIRTTLERTAANERLFVLLERALIWLNTHPSHGISVLKWQTDRWGEIPADFGRK